MSKIKVTSKVELYDGMSITFKAPCDCTAVDGLNVHYQGVTHYFSLRDAHGNDLAGVRNLFSAGTYVKVILDTASGIAYIQNADSNAYLEDRLDNILKDETKAKFGMGADAVPDDIFQYLSIRTPKIGDILSTVRTDLDDTWVLTNGAEISEETHPEIYEVYREQLCAPMTGGSGAIYSTSGVFYAAGRWIVCGGTDSGDLEDGNPVIFTTTDPRGVWERKVLSESKGYLTSVAYYNGTWVAVGRGPSTSWAFVTTDPTGEWTNLGGLGFAFATGVACHEGTWVACGHSAASNYYPYVAYTTDPFGTWTAKKLASSSFRATDITYCAGQWAVAYGSVNSQLKLYTASTPEGDWTLRTAVDTTYALKKMKCADNKLVAMRGNSSVCEVDVSTDPTGDWTQYVIALPELAINQNRVLADITYQYGRWFISGCVYSSLASGGTRYPRVWSATELDGNWEEFYAEDINMDLTGIGFYGTRDMLGVGYSGKSEFKVIRTGAWLPTIENDKVYTYMKVKE